MVSAGVGYVTIALTLVTLVMCEIAPKSYAVQHATQVARAVIRPIAAMSVLVYPLGRICTGLVNAFFKLMNIQGSAEPFVSEEELKLVLRYGLAAFANPASMFDRTRP